MAGKEKLELGASNKRQLARNVFVESPNKKFISSSSSSSSSLLENGEDTERLTILQVERIMRKILPPDARITKRAKETMRACATEFLSFVTRGAAQKCKSDQRSILTGEYVCWAFGNSGFDDYVMPLKRYLEKYREDQRQRLDAKEQFLDEKFVSSSVTKDAGEKKNSEEIEGTKEKDGLVRIVREVEEMMKKYRHLIGDDIYVAMENLGYADYVEPLKRYREAEANKKEKK